MWTPTGPSGRWPLRSRWQPVWCYWSRGSAGGAGPPFRSFLMPVAAAGLLLASCRRLLRPLERLRAPEDVGYVAAHGRSRARTANEVRRRRRVGELPPAFPNGRYRVVDSQQLWRGQVRDVSVLSKCSCSVAGTALTTAAGA